MVARKRLALIQGLLSLQLIWSSFAFSNSKSPRDPGAFSLANLGDGIGDGIGMSDEELLGGKIPPLPGTSCADPLKGKTAKPSAEGPATKTAGAGSTGGADSALRAGNDAFQSVGGDSRYPRPFVNVYRDESRGIDKVADLADFVSPDLRTGKFSPVFLSGEFGSGRTAFIEWVAAEARKNSDTVPRALRGKNFYSLDLSKLNEGATQQIDGIINRVKKEDAVLFIPRGKSLIPEERDNLSDDAIKARRILLSKIDAGEIRVVIEGDYSVFLKLGKTFTTSKTVEISTPDATQLRDILNAYKANLEQLFSVKITQEAIDQLVVMSTQFLRGAGLPGAAIEILESEVGRALRNRADNDKNPVNVGIPEMARGLAKKTGRSVDDMARNERDIILNGRKKLEETVFGQPQGIEAVMQALEYAFSPLKAADDMTPVDFILILGPTGVGKTLLAQATAALTGWPLIERNMEQYIEKHTLSEILGSPPGYEGSGDTTTLVHEIKKKIRAIVLLDEFEKAHKEIKQAFLGAPENGKLVGRDRAEALLRETLWIMASNAAEALISRGAPMEEIMAELHNHFPAAFLGRCKIVIFNKFGRKELRQIVPMIEAKFVKTLASNNTQVSIDPAVLDGIVEATNVDLGARNLRNTFRALVAMPLAGPYHRGLWKKGDRLHIFRKENEIWFKVEGSQNPSEHKLGDINRYLSEEELAAQEDPGDATLRAIGEKTGDAPK